jgi:hypothetical protein
MPGPYIPTFGRYDAAMADRAEVERELEEIRAQLGWVRDYL